MDDRLDSVKRMAFGAAGGLAGTLILQALLAVRHKWLPSTAPPFRQEPGQFMVETAEEMLPAQVGRRIPDTVEIVAAQALGAGYGLAFGILYSSLCPRGGSAWRDGLVLGTVTWAAGYLGWLPTSGVMRPIWEQRPAQVILPIAEHVVYGVTTVAAYDWLHEQWSHA